MNSIKSQAFFKDAIAVIPGGVNSPVRACGSVGGNPLFIDKAEGSKIFDVDGNCYIDYVGSWGPMILGHRHPAVIEALGKILQSGTSFGAPTPLETELANLLIEFVPSIDMVRMVNSGTEATMSALRLARGFTGRDIIIKFDGCYHGHADTLLVAAGSGVATLGIPGSPGVPESVIKNTLSIQYNNIDAFTEVMKKMGDKVAAVIVEPVAGNMGLVLPVKGFLETLRELTLNYGALLIFDEVMTGFRVAKGSAQGLFNITPDLSCFGKIIGGGLPVGSYGGKKEIMNYIAPVGPVYQAGTLSGNPLAMAAGIATLTELKKDGFYEDLERKTDRLVSGLKKVAQEADIEVTACNIGSMGGLFFTSGPVNNFDDAKKSNLERFGNFYRKMREKGIYLAPSQFEAFFVSSAHSDADIDMTIKSAQEVMQSL
ncbi:MAG: glutamate-1-semialdehyde 2,1-aminomutase [Desulfamplus sp.]|nr:glutamate-1-semialdehyde 2,1-aminomutase [Desulfamplus sp.]